MKSLACFFANVSLIFVSMGFVLFCMVNMESVTYGNVPSAQICPTKPNSTNCLNGGQQCVENGKRGFCTDSGGAFTCFCDTI
jgi:hypothetical protein